MKRKKTRSGSGNHTVQSGLPHHHRSHVPKKIVIKKYDETPNRFRSKIDPLNLEEQKLQFLKHGVAPHFQFKVAPEKIEELSQTKRAEIEFDLLSAATHILEKVRHKYGTSNLCVEQMYGERITRETASQQLSHYLQQNGADGHITIGWARDLACSAKMVWCGPSTKANRPEARKYSLWLKDSSENLFLREKGIICLANHEIGTHFFRTLNEGLQPWYSNREQFGLKRLRSPRLQETEEGLATVNTLIQANQKFLWIPALIYYTACKASIMTFEELFAHLGHFLENRELRWRYVMRVKRSLPDPGGVGGYGNDQCYFKGAVEILQNLENIDFHLLYAGKVCVESLPRIRRMARLECIRLPHFMQDMAAYIKTLKSIAAINGLTMSSKSYPPSKGISQKRKKKTGRNTAARKRRHSNAKTDNKKSTADTAPNEDDDEGLVFSEDEEEVEVEVEEGDAIFNRTFDHSVGTTPGTTLGHSCDNSHRTGSQEMMVTAVRSPSAVSIGKKFSGEVNDARVRTSPPKTFLHPRDDGSDPREPSCPTSHQLSNLHLSQEIRSRSQLSIVNVQETGQSLSPPLDLCTPHPPRLSSASTKSTVSSSGSVGRTDGARLSPSKPSTAPQPKLKRGGAEREVSPLMSTMPAVSSRFNRENNGSPVPFSPHRWLLWKREKSSPNTLH
ncbi:uncharacterized protein [Diadema antillarum]|uniref:uncharacterized protein n=1 Tax=Diadema antillarum TaxID=105358 RepID=UPI003A8998F4